MNNNLKITISVFISFSIAFSALGSYLYYYNQIQSSSLNELNVDSRILDTKQRSIILVGSSYVGQLNASYIQEYISNKGLDQYLVYNTAVGSDTPSQRLPLLNHLIALKPKLVVYGIGLRDIGFTPYDANPWRFSNPKPDNCVEINKQLSKNKIMYVNNTNIQNFNTEIFADPIGVIEGHLLLKNILGIDVSNMPNPKHVTIDIWNTAFGKKTK